MKLTSHQLGPSTSIHIHVTAHLHTQETYTHTNIFPYDICAEITENKGIKEREGKERFVVGSALLQPCNKSLCCLGS